jgi:hypothetical protein
MWDLLGEIILEARKPRLIGAMLRLIKSRENWDGTTQGQVSNECTTMVEVVPQIKLGSRHHSEPAKN